MSDESDFLKNLREASIKGAVEHLRILQRLKESRSESSPSQQPDPAKSAPADWTTPLGDLLFDAARLQLNAYTNLLGLSAKYTDQIIERLRSITQPAPNVPPRQTLALSGPAGGVARALSPFVIHNQLSTPAQFALSASEFHNVAGGPYFSAKVDFEAQPPCADDRSLAPRAQRGFGMTVKLAPPFQAGQQYTGEVYVMLRGRVAEMVDVHLSVTTSPTQPPTPPRPEVRRAPAVSPEKTASRTHAKKKGAAGGRKGHGHAKR